MAFSNGLKRDYGTYYCITCNDMFPENNLEEFDADTNQYRENNGGLLYYRSDLSICEEWKIENKRKFDQTNQYSFSKPVMIFAGKYDPITPLSNGKLLKEKYEKSILIEMPYGHGTSFIQENQKLVSNFISNPNNKLKSKYKFTEINFIDNISLNNGISNLAGELRRPNLVFLSPLILALIIITVTAFTYLIKVLIKGTQHKELKIWTCK